MQHHLSECIADFLLSQKIIKIQEKEIYVYGIQLIISSIVNLLICITISLLLGELINGLVFFASFSSLRRFTGGFHCKTFVMCNVVFSLIVAFVLLSNTFLGEAFENYLILIATVIFTFLCILLFSPVYNENKELTYIKKKRFRVLSMIVYAIHISFYLTLLIVFDFKLNIIVIGDLMVSLMIIWGVINNIVMKK